MYTSYNAALSIYIDNISTYTQQAVISANDWRIKEGLRSLEGDYKALSVEAVVVHRSAHCHSILYGRLFS
jgi:hypothetical protein